MENNPEIENNLKIENKPLIGGCSGTEFGCCPDGVTVKKSVNDLCDNKPTSFIKENCTNSTYGCCPDGVTTKRSVNDDCSIDVELNSDQAGLLLASPSLSSLFSCFCTICCFILVIWLVTSLLSSPENNMPMNNGMNNMNNMPMNNMPMNNMANYR